MEGTGAVRTLEDALRVLGRDRPEIERHPVLHGAAGTLLALSIARPDGPPEWAAVWISGDVPAFLGPDGIPTTISAAHKVPGGSGRLLDLLAETNRAVLIEAETLEERIAHLEEGRSVGPGREVWALHRQGGAARARIARAIAVAYEVSGPLQTTFPEALRFLPTLLHELERTRERVLSLQQSLNDLILLRNAEDSNRLAETGVRLAEFSNRIAVLTNTSNIRMLGITYVALLLGLVSAAVLIPNTAATILGMPSAAWVPGVAVDAILLVLAILPAGIIFTRPWVVRLLRDLRTSESRTSEGIGDLPELVDDDRGKPPPRSSSRGG